MTLQDFITGLEEWIESLEKQEQDISPLDCCDNRELEILQDILSTARKINDN